MWIEAEDQHHAPARTCDVSFKIECAELPVDHAAELSKSLCRQQSWLEQLEGTGVHPIHVAGSQNGWQRPDGESQLLLLSRRTRLRIRVETSYADKLIAALKGSQHSVDNYKLKILDGRITPLQPSATLFSRYTVYRQDQHNDADEQTLIQRVFDSCNELGYRPGKILCGRSTIIATADGPVVARSVLLADVPVEYSLKLQDAGLGNLRLIGCGILIPHKDTGAVNG